MPRHKLIKAGEKNQTTIPQLENFLSLLDGFASLEV